MSSTPVPQRELTVEALTVRVYATPADLASAAADLAAATLEAAIAAQGAARLMLATGNSQLAFLDALVTRPGVDWSAVSAFHLDEYVGLSPDHPASFQRYMRERVAARLPVRTFHYIDGAATDPDAEARRYAELLAAAPLDLACVGIGDNGHLAFNDPPAADFDDPLAVKVVALDDDCKRQQVGEGHFVSLDAVPPQAITVTMSTLLAARAVLAIAPGSRKVAPVARSLHGPVSTACPASILRRAAHAVLLLDADSAAGI